MGYNSGKGYGVVSFNGSQIGAHRLICEWANGPSDGKNHAAHSCGISRCVNPKHLRWATAKENSNDNKLRGITNAGERHGVAKFSNAEVAEIRKEIKSGVKQRRICEKYGVSPMTISRIARGASYVVT